MIGFYIITQMIPFILKADERKETIAVKIFAAITILVSIFSISFLLTGGTPEIPKPLR
jgi:hypothetical protein